MSEEETVFGNCRAARHAGHPIDHGTARTIANWWHDGGHGYAFASTGVIDDHVRAWMRKCPAEREPGDLRLALEELTRYIRESGDRGPVPYWSDMWASSDSYTVTLGDGSTLCTHRVTEDGSRPNRYAWSVYAPDGRPVDSGAELTCGTDHGAKGAMADLCRFLGAFAEARQYGPESENYNLFREQLAAWAVEHGDEIMLAGMEIEDDA